MILYTCPFGTSFGGLGPASHPCGRAAKALTDHGHRFEQKKVKGGIGMVWTLPSRDRDRAEVRELSGSNWVPILVLDDGQVVKGSGSIVAWAKANPAG